VATGFKLAGAGWNRLLRRLQLMQAGYAEAARARFLIGSTLPYASHWIEEGWRDDPRYGQVRIVYRTPATWFMREAAEQLPGIIVRARRPGETTVGPILNGAQMAVWADGIAEAMKQILAARVYSVPVPTSGGRARWQRTHALYNSIKAYRA
jgi:hypothetical protein